MCQGQGGAESGVEELRVMHTRGREETLQVHKDSYVVREKGNEC